MGYRNERRKIEWNSDAFTQADFQNAIISFLKTGIYDDPETKCEIRCSFEVYEAVEYYVYLCKEGYRCQNRVFKVWPVSYLPNGVVEFRVHGPDVN